MFVTDWGLVRRLSGGPQQARRQEPELFMPNAFHLIDQLMNFYLLIPNWLAVTPARASLWADLWLVRILKGVQSG